MYQYFWDVEPDKIDLDKNTAYVIERVMDWGKTEDIRWLVKWCGREKLKQAVQNRRGLSRKSAVFWAHVLKINQAEVACLQKPYQRQRFGP